MKTLNFALLLAVLSVPHAYADGDGLNASFTEPAPQPEQAERPTFSTLPEAAVVAPAPQAEEQPVAAPPKERPADRAGRSLSQKELDAFPGEFYTCALNGRSNRGFYVKVTADKLLVLDKSEDGRYRIQKNMKKLEHSTSDLIRFVDSSKPKDDEIEDEDVTAVGDRALLTGGTVIDDKYVNKHFPMSDFMGAMFKQRAYSNWGMHDKGGFLAIEHRLLDEETGEGPVGFEVEHMLCTKHATGSHVEDHFANLQVRRGFWRTLLGN